MNDYHDYVPDALEMASAYEIPAADFARVVTETAQLMAGLHLEPSPEIQYDLPFASLRF